MGQSDLHRWLVEQLASSWLKWPADWERARIDGDGGLPCPLIDGFRPDVIAYRRDGSSVVIGEAKTVKDVESEHSISQIQAYFRYLAGRTGGRLEFAVPWTSLDAMYFVARGCRRLAAAQGVPYVVHAWAPPRFVVVRSILEAGRLANQAAR